MANKLLRWVATGIGPELLFLFLPFCLGVTLVYFFPLGIEGSLSYCYISMVLLYSNLFFCLNNIWRVFEAVKSDGIALIALVDAISYMIILTYETVAAI